MGDDSAPDDVTAIGEDETAQAWNAIVIIEDERRPGLQSQFTDFVRSQFGTPGRRRIERRRIDDVRDRYHLALDILRDQLEPIPRTGQKRLASNPKHLRPQPVRLDGRIGFVRGNMAALDEDVVAQGDSDRFARTGRLRGRRRPPFDRSDPGGLVVRRKQELIADSAMSPTQSGPPICGDSPCGKHPGWGTAGGDRQPSRLTSSWSSAPSRLVPLNQGIAPPPPVVIFSPLLADSGMKARAASPISAGKPHILFRSRGSALRKNPPGPSCSPPQLAGEFQAD